MSYQVLARKWRPHTFTEVVGQQHVLKPLTHALTTQRLHHAWLLTGTRGVGKTTIARILAKSLNCEQGITPQPCGTCGACKAIDEGRFVDLLEIDAASRTKVEDTRELLDNVQYKPTQGRYKVYLIDEVHMLSRHSFNALLKTLEEPPEHVKFLLATTDPQKLPITVLSRCLQFNLKALSRQEIADHLQHVLEAESIPYDAPALQHLARAAQGSLRDALSLTDQAIAQGEQKVTNAAVQQMLGNVPGYELAAILQAVIHGHPQQTLDLVDKVAGQVPDIGSLLTELQRLVHQLALVQQVPASAELFAFTDAEQKLVQLIPAELLHIFYDILSLGRRDLNYAVDARSGVEMTILRLLAFRPEVIEVQETSPDTVTRQEPMQTAPVHSELSSELSPELSPEFSRERSSEPHPEPELEPELGSEPEPEPTASSSADSVRALIATRDALDQKKNNNSRVPQSIQAAPEFVKEPTPAVESAPRANPEPTPEVESETDFEAHFNSASQDQESEQAPETPTTRPEAYASHVRKAAEVDGWAAIIDNLDLHGLPRQLAMNSTYELAGQGVCIIRLRQQWAHLLSDSPVQVLTTALQASLDVSTVRIEVAPSEQQTPVEIQADIDRQRLLRARQNLQDDPLAQALQNTFQAQLIEDSIQPS
ncbi:DNA polymerase III subunit gamma/tau [Pseudidiomarina aestuarii]|uniref:DNA polymerase III subunit gamma/tau n=1 Tax=Pseudidiomarina aestuarii TaxID=624146 RepID=A0A7Z6ZTY0_9GAMM|nr:DNA polymerase III subunit gamma/tau [Pseudidiomarina aestuarii]RUO41338.1 DNA polymerase III subunit gamma/tau [Pseudidiomarina aestuarii]